MKILILGDLIGNSGRKALQENLSKIIEERSIDFTILNGENAAEDGKGITKNITDELFKLGVDVITSGNHIWDKKETSEFITKEERLLRPENLAAGSPGNGFGIFLSKNNSTKTSLAALTIIEVDCPRLRHLFIIFVEGNLFEFTLWNSILFKVLLLILLSFL